VLAVAKVSDLLLIVLDPLKGIEQKLKILHELQAMGIRINKQKPDIYIERKKTGGMNFTSSCRLTHLDEQMVKVILQEYKINNVDVIIRGDYTVDDLIDAIEGNRKYVDAIFVYNKIDLVSIEDIDELARRPGSVVISVNLKLNLEFLLKSIWEKLNLIRIYTKKKGAEPNFDDPIILTQSRKGCTIEAVCGMIHKDFANDFKYALGWGRSSKFSPQTCGLSSLIRP
jgi:ribosome-interacting GTPase 1